MAEDPARCEFSTISITPTHLEFECEEGTPFSVPYQTLYLLKNTDGTLTPSWKASRPDEWLRMAPESGKAPEQMHIRVPKDLASGVYDTTISFTSRDTTIVPSEIPVKFTVHPKEQPPEEPETRSEGLGISAEFHQEETPEPPPPPPPPPEEKWYHKLIKAITELLKRFFGGGNV